MLVAALVVFALMYVLMLAFAKWRVYFSLGAALIMVVMGVLSPGQALGAINWNVLMMIAGTMGIVTLFIETGMPAKLSRMLLGRVPDVCMAVTVLALFAGIISAFVDNVATVLMVAPVGLAISKELKISPVPVLIAIAVSSNLQGAATLVGDTTSILLGGYAGMNFLDFIFMDGRFSIFWAVELGAIATIPVLLFLFRRDKKPVPPMEGVTVTDYFPSILMLAVVVLLIAASFIPESLAWPVLELKNGLICIFLCAVGVIRACVKRRGAAPFRQVVAELDTATLLMLAGLFIVVEAITQAGVVAKVAGFFVGIGGQSLFLLYTIIVFASVILSAFIDNIPYVAAMLPVVQGMAEMLGVEPTLLYFGLLSGATLGGNITPVGASANVTAIGILRREGYEVSTKEFMRIGLPFTLTAVLVGYVFIWLIWA